MRCSRCKGHLVKDRMYDLPRKIMEFYCVNCGERFWQERAEMCDPGIIPAETRPKAFSKEQRADWLVVQSN